MANALAFIHEENGVFGVSFPDFPGCTTTADTLDNALERGAQVLAFHIEGMAAEGLPLPVLRGSSALRGDPDLAEWMKGAILAAIPVELPAKAVRVNISMDETLLQRLDRAAESAGQSRSAFLAEAVRGRINALAGREAA
jgi:predicted RNase H-like HicB family nuclease